MSPLRIPFDGRDGGNGVVILSLAVALVATIVTCLVFSPRFVMWRGLETNDAWFNPEVSRAFSTLQQVDDPWEAAEYQNHRGIAWRLLFPLIWHYLRLPRGLFLAMPQLGCVLALWLAAWLTQQRLRHWWRTAMAVTLFAALPWFFVSSGWLTYFDSWLVLALLVVSFVRNRQALFVSCLLTPWVDERFLLALPLCLAIRLLSMGRVEATRGRGLVRELAWPALACLSYVAIRGLASLLFGDGGSSAYVQAHWQEASNVPWTRYVQGLWSGFRAGWLMIAAALILLWRRVGWQWGLGLAGWVLLIAAGGLFIAGDMSRSMMMLSPMLLLGIWLWHERRAASLARVLPAVLLANLLLPAEHVVWSYRVPIASLYSEIHAYRRPPFFLEPSAYVAWAEQRLSGGELAWAHKDCDTAIRLDPGYVPAYLLRAVVRMNFANGPGALEDIDTALRLSPGSPEALLLRARVYEARGDSGQTVRDLRNALANAPSEWKSRDQALRLLDRVTGSPPPSPRVRRHDPEPRHR